MDRKILVFMLIAGMTFGASKHSLAASFSVNSVGTALINLDNGNDKIMLSSGTTEHSVNYVHGDRTGSLYGVKNLVLNGRGGHNAITLTGLIVEGNVTIRASGDMNAIGVYAGSVGRRLTVVSGSGNDDINLSGVVVKGTSSINTSGGDDTIEMRNLTVGRTLQILTGNGDDNVLITVSGKADAMSLMGRAHINTSNGDDTIMLESTMVAGRMAFVTGSGQDKITLSNNFMDTLVVNTGAQNDHVTAIGNTVVGSSQLNGTSGTADVYQQDETNVYGVPHDFRGFEIERPIIAVPYVPPH